VPNTRVRKVIVNMRNGWRCLLVLVLYVWSSILPAATDVEILVKGLDKNLEQNVRLFISIEQQKNHALLNAGRLKRLHQKAPGEIEQALQPFGYYRPDINSQLHPLEDNRWQAIYQVDPGPAITIAEFNLRVNPEIQADEAFNKFLNNLPLNSGDVFLHQEYESIKTALLRLASERGYFDAHFPEHIVSIDLEKYEARVQLLFEGGYRYKFGDVMVTGNVLEPELLDRYMNWEKGAEYQLRKLVSLQHTLSDSNYFQSVEITPGQPQFTTQQIPVNLTLTPRNKSIYSIGLGYGTDTGARAKLGYEKPLVNARGHQIKTEFDISEIGNTLSASYSVPVLDPRTDRLVYSVELTDEETDTNESRLQTVGVSLNQTRGDWREKLFLELQQEDYSVADIDDQVTSLVPGVSWSRIWGSDVIYTLDGIRLNIGLKGATEEILSDFNFIQLKTGIKFIHRLAERYRFIVRGSLGITWTDEFVELPSSLRFFAGGTQSVRGYAYESLGPTDESGEVVGGNHLMVGSIEFEHLLTNKWGVALFTDAGNALDSFKDELEIGAGLGLRWKSPVGSIRIDFASALTADGEPWRIHINIGPDL